MTSRAVTAVLPVKDLAGAKQRLSPALSPEERCGLFRAMFEDVLEALRQAQRVDRVLLVTRDAAASRLADQYGAAVLVEDENLGQTQAVQFAATTLADEEVETLIALPADVPLATAAEIDAVLAAHRDTPAITIAPAHDKLGSNAVACSPPAVLPFRFGDNSFYPHLERARSLGIEPTVVEQPGLALDIDNPADLQTFIARPSSTRAYRFLEEQGILDRLRRDPGAGTGSHP